MGKGKISLRKIGLVGFGVLSVGSVLASAAPAVENHPWYVAAGLSYPFVYGTNTSGNLIESGLAAPINAYVSNSNLSYTSQFSPEIMLGYAFTNYFALSLFYSQVNSNINTKSSILPTGSNPFGNISFVYSAQATINNFFIQPRFIWSHAAQTGRVFWSPYVALDLGVSNIALSNQSLGSTNMAYLPPKSTWNFAWGGELGMINALSSRVDLTYGARYVNYGKYNSGVTPVNEGQGAGIVSAVKATLYSISPFVNISYHF